MKLSSNLSRRSVSALLTILFATLLGGATVFAQTTAFTYQGKLIDGANASPTGAYDLRFTLDTGDLLITCNGAAVTNQICENVSVVNGIFTVRLDFGAAAFGGAMQNLGIGVRRGDETGAFTPLAPAQPITGTPYAIRTLSATAADSLSNACNGCVTNAQINSVAGTKITGSVANADNATNAQTANTATTAGNVTGVVAIANGGTGSTTKNFVDLTTDQTVAGNKTLTGNLRVNGLIRTGSETGTTDAPQITNSAYSGLVVRRINSLPFDASVPVGEVVARTDYLRLERDGTAGGWRISNDALPADERLTVHCFGITNTGTIITARLSLLDGAAAGSRTLFTNAQGVEYMQCSFGNPYNLRHLTQVTLQRAPTGNNWVGTVTSTFNQ